MLYHFVKYDVIYDIIELDIIYDITYNKYDITSYITWHSILRSRYDIIVTNPSWYPQIHDVVCYIAGFFYYIVVSRGDIIDSGGDIIDSGGDIVCYILCHHGNFHGIYYVMT